MGQGGEVRRRQGGLAAGWDQVWAFFSGPDAARHITRRRREMLLVVKALEAIGSTVMRWVSLRCSHLTGYHELTTSMQESVGQPFVNLARDVNELLTV
jgi:hypothetical protein